MLTQLFQFDIRLEVVVRRPSHNVYDGRDTTCSTAVVHAYCGRHTFTITQEWFSQLNAKHEALFKFHLGFLQHRYPLLPQE